MRKVNFLLMGLLMPFLLAGQTDTLRLRLQDAVNRAIEHNLMQKASELEIQKKEAKIQEYLAAIYPALQASGSYTRNIKKPVIFMPEGSPFGPTLTIGSDNAYNGSLSFNLPLFSMSIYESIKMGRADKRLSEEKERENRINLAATVKNTYYNLLLLEQTIEVYTRSYENARQNLANIEQMNARGVVSDYDVIRARVQVDNLYPGLLQVKNAYQNLLNIFRIMLDIPMDQPVVLDPADLVSVDLQHLPAQEVNWLSSNPTLRQLEATRRLLGIQENMVKASYMPMLMATGNYTYQTQANNFDFGKYKWVNSSAVGLQFSMPLFKGFAMRRQLDQSRLGIKQLDYQEEYTRQNLTAQAENALNAMKTALAKIKSAESNVALAQKGYRIAQTRYNSGQATLVELNDADNALMQARLNLIQARFDFLSARTDYEKLIGKDF
ncbi:MAG: TolC family protein [Bacteroidales bacterium]